MADDVVGDEEQLYRRVPNIPGFFAIKDGRLRLSGSCFNDVTNDVAKARPSVDRAKLRDHDPRNAKTAPTQGVVELVAGEVRQIGSVTQTDNKGNVTSVYSVDVLADPLDDNAAHAVIAVSPKFESKRPFERLREALARLAERRGWLVEPSDG